MRRGRQTPTFEYVGGYDHSDGTRVHLGLVCTHPARPQGVYVNTDDCPYNPCASENARSCPMKWSDG